jgi:predicted molibdopterin-dependent oxidoreductase YjgC
MLSDPDITHVAEALKKVDFLVVQDIFLTETAQLADVVLPAASFAEKDGAYTNTERRVRRLRKTLLPPGKALADWEIISRLAGELGYKDMNYADPGQILDEINRLTPIYGGITWKRISQSHGLQWPCPDENHPGTPVLHVGKFSRGKGLFHAIPFIEAKELPDNEYPMILTTGRVREHFHTGTMSRRAYTLDNVYPTGMVEIHPQDAEKLGIADGDKVQVKSRRGVVELPATVLDKTAPGTVFIAFHFKEAPANRLTIAALDPQAKIPEFKVCAVKVGKA